MTLGKTGFAMPQGAIPNDNIHDPFFDRLPRPVSEQLSIDQKSAIAAALPGRIGVKPPVNIRMSVPMLRWRFYFAINGGKERRSKPRLAADRKHNPLMTRGNTLSVVLGATTLYLATLGGFLVYASILQV
ncbi:MAG: hypothetical protein CMM52_16650 [Rhodospirillaceae bacterium]|nr:hypothetical protein [Rhodospirillaceae bacterium]|tara:strand:- start:68013 stop:68402 length:390 start_codon:yes stop_codon:yes gene_type:complete